MRSEVLEIPDWLHQKAEKAGAKVLSFRELTYYTNHTRRELIQSCFDERYQDAMKKFAGRIHQDHIEILRLPLPGAGVRMLVDNPARRDWLLSGLLQWAVEVQTVARFHLVAHIDCGAYGGSKAFGFDLEYEELCLTKGLRKAREILRKRFPGVEVCLYIASPIEGTIKHDRATIAFKPIDAAKGTEVIIVEAKFSSKHLAKTLVIGCPETMLRKTTHELFHDAGLHFRLNVPGGPQFFNNTDDVELIKYLLDVPIRECEVTEIATLAHTGCGLSYDGFKPFLSVSTKIEHFVTQGNTAREVIRSLYSDLPLAIRPIYGHTFTMEGRPVIAYIES